MNLSELVEAGLTKVDSDVLERYGDRYAAVDTNDYITIQFSRKDPQRRQLLHRFIMKGFEVVHHKNNIKSDNRRENLVGTTQSTNTLLKRIPTDGTTRGTSLHKQSGLWRARLQTKTLGYYKTREEAKAAYDLAYAKLVEDRLNENKEGSAG